MTGAGRRPVETDRDPGLQPERTRLAWRRTTLSFAVTSVLAARQALRGDGRVLPALAVFLAAAAFLFFLWTANRRIQRLGAAAPPRLPPPAATAIAASTAALAAFGAALLW